MSYVLAIDVGTSFTAAALVKPGPGSLKPGDGSTPTPEILPLGLHGSAVPSVLYYAEDGRVLVGEAAERRGLDDPRRMVREFKRRIGDSVPIAVGEQWLAPEEIFAGMARWVADRAEEREGSPASAVVMCHPAAWGQHRLSGVLAALDAAGLPEVTLISEPEAAALHYASQTRVDDGSIIAVYDLGGGTFDTAILRKAAAGNFELLGHPDGMETLGGADFDAAVLRHVVGHLGGAVDELEPEAPATLAALSRLRRECREAKEALSMDSEATIAVALPGTQQSVRLVRSEFEALIESPVRETVAALERSLGKAGLQPEDLSAVLLIGGSSRIPLVAELISEGLDRPIAVDADPKSSICLGAAVAALRAVEGAGVETDVVAVAALRAVEGAGVDAPGAAVDADTVAVEDAGVLRRSAPQHAPAAISLASSGGHSGHSTAHSGPKPGRHAPKSRVRMTAAAAAAATVLTIATATAAQSPEGTGLMASMFGAQAADVIRDGGTRDGGTPDGAQQAGGAVAGGAGSAPVSGKPASGLDASARAGTTRTGNKGQLPIRQGKTGAGTTGTGSDAGTANAGTGAGAAVGGSGGTAAGGTTTPGTSTSPGTGSTTPGTSTPTSPPATTPGGAASGPTPDPSVPPVQDPTTPPATDPSTPPVVPTTPSDPAPTTPSDPAPPAPEPTAPLPEPTTIQDPAPAPTDPAPSPSSSESSPPPDPALTPAV